MPLACLPRRPSRRSMQIDYQPTFWNGPDRTMRAGPFSVRYPGSGRPRHLAAGLGKRQCRGRAFDFLIDNEQILGIVLALRLRVSDAQRWHQLIVAFAEESILRHQ